MDASVTCKCPEKKKNKSNKHFTNMEPYQTRLLLAVDANFKCLSLTVARFFSMLLLIFGVWGLGAALHLSPLSQSPLSLQAVSYIRKLKMGLLKSPTTGISTPTLLIFSWTGKILAELILFKLDVDLSEILSSHLTLMHVRSTSTYAGGSLTPLGN